MTHYYLTPWESYTDVDGGPTFRPTVAGALLPGVYWSCIDLRPDPTLVDGYALLACALRPLVDPPAATYLGDSLDIVPNVPNRRGIESRLGLPKDSLSGSYREIIVAILTQWGTEDGLRWRPLQRALDGLGTREIWLGGELIWTDAGG